MIPHQRHESTMNSHFSFSNSFQRDEETQSAPSSHNMKDYNAWAEGIKSNYTRFGNTRNQKPGAWTSRSPPNSNSAQFYREEEFRSLAKLEAPDSDTPSPTLWQNSPTRESLYSVRSNDGKFGNHQTRAQEIAGYRKEMIDMVRGLPEAAYELSLRDIVEKRKEFEEIKPVNGKPKNKKEKKKVIKKNPSISRSKSLDTGFLIKMFLPLSVGRKSFNGLFSDKKENKEEVKSKEKKIETNKFNDEEWWKKNEFSDKGSSKGSSSSSSGYHSGSSRGYNVSRTGSRKRNGCYSFFRPGKVRNRTSSRQ